MPGGPGGSTHELLGRKLRRLLEGFIDPEVTLPGEEEPVSDSTSDLVKRLEAHGPKQTRYRLEGEVARGGMGAILQVWDEDLRRKLAMKVVLGDEVSGGATTDQVDAKTLGRFLEEAQITGQLEHPGVVPVHELGLDEGGRVYFTMRLVKGQVEEAGELLAEAQAELEQLFGEERLATLASYGNRGLMCMQFGNYEEAEANFRRAYEGYRATFGEEHASTLISRGNLGAAYFRQGELDEAEVRLRAAFEGFRRLIGERGEATVTNETHLSAVQRDRGQCEEAEQLARDAARNGEEVPGWSRDHWRTAEARSLRGEALVCLERYDEAEPILLEAYETLERRIPRSRRKRTLARTATALVDLYRATDRPDEAARWQAVLEDL